MIVFSVYFNWWIHVDLLDQESKSVYATMQFLRTTSELVIPHVMFLLILLYFSFPSQLQLLVCTIFFLPFKIGVFCCQKDHFFQSYFVYSPLWNGNAISVFIVSDSVHCNKFYVFMHTRASISIFLVSSRSKIFLFTHSSIHGIETSIYGTWYYSTSKAWWKWNIKNKLHADILFQSLQCFITDKSTSFCIH